MTSLPPYVQTLVTLLRYPNRETPNRAATVREQWNATLTHDLLTFADRTQCTLFLRGLPNLPSSLEEAIEVRYQQNLRRRARIRAEYQAIADQLTKHGIEFVLLKSFTHESESVPGPQRVQYDIDLLVPPESAPTAHQAIAALGYVPHGSSNLSDLHTRPLVLPSPWQWRGDYYDPDMPIPVELHTRLWDDSKDRLPAPGLDAFWNRRTTLQIDGLTIPALHPADRWAFAALHVLRHALHNNIRPSHVLELARFLSPHVARAVQPAASPVEATFPIDARPLSNPTRQGGEACLWDLWKSHPPQLRTLETVAFRFAAEWFDSPLPDPVLRHWESLSPRIHTWFANFAFSPLANLLEPNKDIVWLHLALASPVNRIPILLRRLLPLRVPARDESSTASYSGHVLRRIWHHSRGLGLAVRSGLRLLRTASSKTSATSDWKRPNV